MALYDLASGALVPVRGVAAGPELYENEIEEIAVDRWLFWRVSSLGNAKLAD